MIRKSHGVAFAALALAATGAFAQSSVNLYGTLDVAAGRFEGAHVSGTKASTTAIENGVMTQSFFGLRGSEDLGGGLKGIFSLESYINVDTGSTGSGARDQGGFWGRNTFVGLAGDFGTVKVGQQDTILYANQARFNPFGAAAVSPTMAVGGLVDTGWSNSISYSTPGMSGFSADVAYRVKETAPGANYALGLNYAAGPLAMGFAYEQQKADAAAIAPDTKSTNWTLGASYDFGVAKAFAQFGQAKAKPSSNKDTYFQLGAAVPVGASDAVLASYGQGKIKPLNDTIRVITLAYDHTLSKRTDVYVAFSNQHETGLSSGNTFAVGVRHSF